MRGRFTKAGSIILILSLLLAWPVGVFAWIGVGPGPQPAGGMPDDTDPDDFPIVSSGPQAEQLPSDVETTASLSPSVRLAIFLARFLVK